MRVLVATTVLPEPSRGGGEVVTAGFVAALARAGAEVDVIGLLRPGAPVPDPPSGVRFHLAERRPIETMGAGTRHRLAWALTALLRREPFSVAKYRARGYDRVLGGLAPWDLAVIDHLQLAWLAPALGRFLLVEHNHEAAIYGGLAEGAGGLARLAWRREQRLVEALERATAAAACEVWALTEADAEILRGAGTDVRVFAVPGAGAPLQAQGAASPEPYVAVLGTWTWGPNLEGLRWLYETVVPRLAGGPAIVVGGRGAERLGPAPAGVRLAGHVPDAGEFLASAAAVAVPAVAGSGVQVKTLDAIASGSPVVATTVALRGIDDPPEGVQVADEPDRFAAALRTAAAGPRNDAGPRWAVTRAGRFEDDVAAALRALVAGGR